MRTRAAGLVLAFAVAVAGCGSGTPEAAPSPSPTRTAPQRIVSLAPTATEMLFAIGAGPQVVAVDSLSNYPPEAPKTKLSAYEPNAEAVAEYRPDLVVLSDDIKNIKAQLERLTIPVVMTPAAKTLEDTYRQLRDLGERTGHAGQATELVTKMRADIQTLTTGLPKRAKPPTYFYELDKTLYTVTSKTFVGQVFALAGFRNVADAVDKTGKSGGYPQLSAEYLIDADPDVVFLADTKCCQQNAKTFAARPGFKTLKAVRTGRVVPLDDDVASRWGPRIVDLLRQIVGVLRAMPAR